MAEKSTTAIVGVVPAADAGADPHSYVDWAAILAGAVLVVAISFVFLTFGSAIGLTLVSPFSGSDASPILLGIAAALWFLWIQVSSSLAGGYLAGRLRRRVWHATPHEAEVRDGAHGLMVWAVGTLFAAMIAASTVAAVAGTATRAATTVATTSISAADDRNASSAGTDLEFFTDTLFRSATNPVAADSQAARQEVLRILARSLGSGSVSEDDKAYLARVVESRTDLSQEEARNRVDSTVQQMEAAAAEAKLAAETARKSAIILAFLTAAGLFVSAAAAWWAAAVGGKHRDEGQILKQLALWR